MVWFIFSHLCIIKLWIKSQQQLVVLFRITHESIYILPPTYKLLEVCISNGHIGPPSSLQFKNSSLDGLLQYSLTQRHFKYILL